MLGTAMSKVCRWMTPSYMQQGFVTTAPFLEEDSEASLLQYFKEEGLSLCPVACTTRLNGPKSKSLPEDRDQLSNSLLA